MVESINYDSFGNGSSSLTRYGYTGREWDSDSNLYYYRNRWYDSQVGRFISEDPIGLNGGINLFTYVGNNPFRFRDPMGLQAQPHNGPYNPFRNPFSVDHWILNGLSNTAADILDAFGACHIANGVWVAADYRRSAGERILGGIEAASTSALWLTGGSALGSAAGEAGVAAEVEGAEAAGLPPRLARVVPEEFAESPTLAGPGAEDAFVTTADDIAGINSSEGLAQRLTIVDKQGNLIQGPRAVIEFDNPIEGLASPINRGNPGFIGSGRTAGGAREFVLPNQPISGLQNVMIRIIP